VSTAKPQSYHIVKIIDLSPDNKVLFEQAARLLVEGFKENWPHAWPTMEAALNEVQECLGPERILRVAIDDNGNILGWIGALTEYNGNAWELHPLVVDPHHQGQGIGRALVIDLEKQVKQRGGISIYLGTDDENQMTSLSGKDLYADAWEHIAHIQNLRGHPYEFYQKMDYAIVGVIPDANGPGKPDIIMAKKIG
jgi:aminoglycoside 6'-N-acetyltransferase I